ncbi:hypothetical protein SCHPADRAFT_871747 [Schizopora paradoxa]|uniref:Uncharacterized protein n=1 Tax=Schizopora paradoxa TaxID=27342 RepID=A0A0H2RTB4_9AGAM|nr:hypothetical protein SCHPADRAFT_871747 [Schizopora paradoxa]
MSSRRRIGVSVATTEAARRQLMQPVPCWEKQWVTPADAPAGSTLKVYRWVKTEKKQNFSDDEDETLDEPLAPLPDEPEANDADDEDQDEAASASGRQTGQATPAISRAVSEPGLPQEETTVRKPHPLSVSLVPDSPTATVAVDGDDALLAVDAALKPLEDDLEIPTLGAGVEGALPELSGDAIGDLTMADLGPDGTQFEGAGDLGQLQGTDSLLGGEMMDQSGDPFEPTE